MSKNILLLAGDGIGPEIVAEAVKVIDCLNETMNLNISYEEGLIGGCSIDANGIPLTDETIAKAKASVALIVLFARKKAC